MALLLVPFNPNWPSAQGPSGAPLLDIKAIYRRPRKTRDGDPILDAAGFPQWDLTSGSPMQHHPKWTARGFEYVTLADRESLVAVSDPGLREQGVEPVRDWRQYVQNRVTEGPWDAVQYLADLRAEEHGRETRLRDAIARFGRAAAEEMEQRVWPGYRLPASFARGATPSVEEEEEPEREAEPAVRVRRKPGPRPKQAVPA